VSTVTSERTTVDARVEHLRTAAEEAGLDAVLATNDASIAYLTGFSGMQLERLFAVAVPVSGGGALVVPRLEEEAAAAAPSGLVRVVYDPSSDGLAELVEALGGPGRVGVEEDHLVLGRAEALRGAGCIPQRAGALVMGLRARKDAREVEQMRNACRVVTEVMEQMFAELEVAAVERAVNALVGHRLRERGATDAHPLILFGPNAANPHGHPGERTLQPGEVVCGDVSAQVDGYWGDLTRCGTVGPPSDWAQAAWETVREAQAAAIAAARVGVPAREVDAAQRRVVEAQPGLGRCLHGAGHAIGGEVHEPPFLVSRIETPLEEGMCFTIEPGLYQTGVGGIRLEDQVLVSADGPILLSDLPLELRRIPEPR
jgi:Xaa-Pro dipeptidase